MKAGTYTVFVEVYLDVWDKKEGWIDGGRLIDTVTSIAAGQKANSYLVADITDAQLKNVQNYLTQYTDYAYWEDVEEDTQYDHLAYAGLDINASIAMAELEPTSVSIQYKVGTSGTVQNYSTADGLLHLTESGLNSLYFRRVVYSSDGTVSEAGNWTKTPVEVYAYPVISVTDYTIPQTLNIATEDSYDITVKSAGGSGLRNTVLTLSQNDGDYSQTADSVNGIVSINNGDNKWPTEEQLGAYTASVVVSDLHLYTKSGKVPLQAAEISVAVTVGNEETVGYLTYKFVADDDVGYRVVVVDYDASANTDPTTVEVAGTVSGYTVVEIADKVFEGETALESITLPNTIEVIGESAFSGCTALNSMDCFDVTETE